MLQIKQVNRQGQLSIGKKYSGRTIEIVTTQASAKPLDKINR